MSVDVVHGLSAAAPFSKTFERLPVIIGRDDSSANCVLPDVSVSRIHASVDVRQGRICVRDAGGRNGTFACGRRIPPDRWVPTGTVEDGCELVIGPWLLTIKVFDAGDSSDDDGFLTAMSSSAGEGGAPATVMLGGVQAAPPPAEVAGGKTQKLTRSAMLPGSGSQAPSVPPASAEEFFRTRAMSPSELRPAPGSGAPPAAGDGLAQSFAELGAARIQMLQAVVRVLDATPQAARRQRVCEIVRDYPELANEPPVRSVLERNLGMPLGDTLEAGAAFALQELARWYVTDLPPLQSGADAMAFVRKLKAGIDELLAGLVPLFAGLDRFEEQLALGDGPDALGASPRVPRTPRDAARFLFNWREPTNAAQSAIRTDLIDLTMHQVGVLNGVMQGVKVMLDELSPAAIDQGFQREQERRGPLGRFFASFGAASAKWSLYATRHGDLADEENERFRVIFGPAFVAEYKQMGDAAPMGPVATLGPAPTYALPAPPAGGRGGPRG